MTLASQIAKPVLARQPEERSVPVLETERLVLRAPRRGDVKAIARLVNDRRVAENTARIPYPYGVDEFQVSGLTPAPSDLVRPPRVLEAHVNMECKLIQIVDVSTRPMGGSLILGEVIRFHLDDSLVDNYRIDPDKLRAIGRMGGNEYTRTRDRFEMIRPKV